MSTQISNVFQNWYDAEVKRAYGDRRLLAGKTYEKTGVEGSTVNFRKKGKGLATQHNSGSEVTYMNTDFSQVTATMQDWEAFDSADKFDAKKINFAEVTELAEVAGDAIGLRMDQIVIDAIDDGRNSSDASYTVGTVGAALTVATLLKGKKRLDKNGVDSTERCFLHNADQLEDLLNTTGVTSADYNTVRTLVNGEVNTFLGLEFVLIADRDEGGLPNPGATSVRGFMYHKRSVGFAVGMDMSTSMAFIDKERAYMVGAEFSACATVIDDKGIVSVQSLTS
jgi:hypothetical protein